MIAAQPQCSVFDHAERTLPRGFIFNAEALILKLIPVTVWYYGKQLFQDEQYLNACKIFAAL
jgi:hypothetical protein